MSFFLFRTEILSMLLETALKLLLARSCPSMWLWQLLVWNIDKFSKMRCRKCWISTSWKWRGNLTERETACQSHVCHTQDSNHAHIFQKHNFSKISFNWLVNYSMCLIYLSSLIKVSMPKQFLSGFSAISKQFQFNQINKNVTAEYYG